jgi:hypothetical protein
MHDIVIRGGTILDGTGANAFTGDVAVDGSRMDSSKQPVTASAVRRTRGIRSQGLTGLGGAQRLVEVADQIVGGL